MALNNKKERKYYNFFELLFCLFIVSVLFFHTLNRPWLIYDENIIFNNTYFPALTSIEDFIEYIKNFGLNFNFVSSNLMYSSNSVRRTVPLGQLLGIITSSILRKDPLLFHLFNLILHLINTTLVFFILKKTLNNSNQSHKFTTSLLTLLWAIHPAMIEPVLLSTNYPASISYFFYFLLYLEFISCKKKNSVVRAILIPIVFLTSMLIAEYLITLPLLLFTISFHKSYLSSNFIKSASSSIKETYPYFIGLFIYIFVFFTLLNYSNIKSASLNNINLILERMFWFSPHILVHFFKLIFFPITLSIDQSIFVKFSDSYFNPYSFFCILLEMIILIPPIIFLKTKKLSSISRLLCTLLISLLPFLHILSPSYILIAERYLYFPIAVILFGIAEIIQSKNKNTILKTQIILMVILVPLFVRSYIRTLDWKDNISFINSTYLKSKKPLFQAIRFGMIAKTMAYFNSPKKAEIIFLFKEAVNSLKKARIEIENKKRLFPHEPKILSAYGLDYNSQISKIDYLITSSRCIELKEDSSIGINILSPHMRNMKTLDPRIVELYAHLLISKNNFTQATSVLKNANELFPGNPFILSKLFEIYFFYLKDNLSAELFLKELLKFYIQDINILKHAVIFYDLQQDNQKNAKFMYLYALRTQSKEVYLNALEKNLFINNLQTSGKIVKKLIKYDYSNPMVLYLASKYYYKIRDYNKSLEFLEKAYFLIKDSNNPIIAFEITTNLSNLYFFLGKKEEAVSKALEALKYTDNNSDLLLELNRLFTALGITMKIPDSLLTNGKK